MYAFYGFQTLSPTSSSLVMESLSVADTDSEVKAEKPNSKGRKEGKKPWQKNRDEESAKVMWLE